MEAKGRKEKKGCGGRAEKGKGGEGRDECEEWGHMLVLFTDSLMKWRTLLWAPVILAASVRFLGLLRTFKFCRLLFVP